MRTFIGLNHWNFGGAFDFLRINFFSELEITTNGKSCGGENEVTVSQSTTIYWRPTVCQRVMGKTVPLLASSPGTTTQ